MPSQQTWNGVGVRGAKREVTPERMGPLKHLEKAQGIFAHILDTYRVSCIAYRVRRLEGSGSKTTRTRFAIVSTSGRTADRPHRKDRPTAPKRSTDRTEKIDRPH